LDTTHRDGDLLHTRFSTILAHFQKRGLDLVKDQLPVTPAAHYTCGGIVTDLHGRTSLQGLYAAGEAARTGLHHNPAALVMQAHSAPLGITFYKWRNKTDRPPQCQSIAPFPKEMDGYAFIAFHGSWNRAIPTGYKVVYVPVPIWDANGTAIVGGPIDLLAHEPPNAQWEDGFRPVDVDFDECGRLLVSSDGSRANDIYRGSKIVRIESTTIQTSSSSSSLPSTPSSGPMTRPGTAETISPTPASSSPSTPSSGPMTRPCSSKTISPTPAGSTSTSSGLESWPYASTRRSFFVALAMMFFLLRTTC
jgi:hypothetical protein